MVLCTADCWIISMGIHLIPKLHGLPKMNTNMLITSNTLKQHCFSWELLYHLMLIECVKENFFKIGPSSIPSTNISIPQRNPLRMKTTQLQLLEFKGIICLIHCHILILKQLPKLAKRQRFKRDLNLLLLITLSWNKVPIGLNRVKIISLTTWILSQVWYGSILCQ